MQCRTVRWLSVICLFSFASMAQACLWDWDTLQMERRRFPGVLEMITGKFVRHSPAYYEWRIQDRQKRMRSPAEDPSLADDLAVALSKLGKHAEALALLEQALEGNPGRYQTLSNLGTIHMLAGDLKTGNDFIKQAIRINPDAHFGREKYQSLLAEYFLTSRKTPHPAADSFDVIHPKGHFCCFAEFVLEKKNQERDRPLNDDEIRAELSAAQQGVLGMMHFADYDSPLLLEALGDLLIAWPTYEEDALQLAARAYYRIAQVSRDETTQMHFKSAARNMVWGHHDYIGFRGDSKQKPGDVSRDELEKLSADLERELVDARAYVAAIAADEKSWIAAGIDVDRAFAAKYYDSLDSTIDAAKKQLSRERRDVRDVSPMTLAIQRGMLILGALVVGGICTIVGCVVYFVRRKGRDSSVPGTVKL